MDQATLSDLWDHEQVLFCSDKESRLRAIIAIHDTTLGPALGGCRFWPYATESEALNDVLRLSKGMTYKAAVAGLPLGGGKAVIIGDPKKLKSKVLFERFGRFVDSLKGRYITAEDVNIKVEDINTIATQTPYATGQGGRKGGSGDPSPLTALGVLYGIKACVKRRLGRDSLQGIKIAVQGCGAVGASLCRQLHKEGALIWISDINPKILQQLHEEIGATVVDQDEIHKIDVDVFAPCALGAGVNQQTIPTIKAGIIAGAANNQLQDETRDSALLEKRNILYAPDYVINAGGLINVCDELKGYDPVFVEEQTKKIYTTLLSIFSDAEKRGISSLQASNQFALDAIDKTKKALSDKKLSNCYDNQSWIAPSHREKRPRSTS